MAAILRLGNRMTTPTVRWGKSRYLLRIKHGRKQNSFRAHYASTSCAHPPHLEQQSCEAQREPK